MPMAIRDRAEIRIDPIPSVREAFFRDLQALGAPGACLLPEWICAEMTMAAARAGWRPVHYRVVPPEQALVPLQLDSAHLDMLLGQLAPPVAVVLAHPLGYLDPHIPRWLRHEITGAARSRAPAVFLDFAQSYGTGELTCDLSRAVAAYVSFNGHKLIRTGGGLRFCHEPGRGDGACLPPAGPSAAACLAELARAGNRQLQQFERLLTDLEESWGAQAIDAIRRAIWPVVAGARANAYRTVIARSAVPDQLMQRIADAGLGQPFDPDPGAGSYRASPAYDRWQQEYVLLFPEVRPEWISRR